MYVRSVQLEDWWYLAQEKYLAVNIQPLSDRVAIPVQKKRKKVWRQRVKSPSDTLTGANEPSGTDGQNGP